MKHIGNILIVLGISIAVSSIFLMANHFGAIDDSCAQKGGLMVKGSNGWICVKVEKL
jgi:hypothetical protein